MLTEECSQKDEHATRHHHLLAEKQGGAQKHIVLLYLPKLVGFKKQENKGYHHQGAQPQGYRFQFFHPSCK